jgi:predicted nucleic acid-binding protein
LRSPTSFSAVIALDTNILVYARREETSHHAWAKEILKEFAEGEQPWALPWPCLYEFIRVVTHPLVFDPPTDLESALDDVDSLLQSPSLTLLREGPRHSVFMQGFSGRAKRPAILLRTRISPH